MLKLLHEKLLVKLPKTSLMCLGIILCMVYQESCLEMLVEKTIRCKRGKG